MGHVIIKDNRAFVRIIPLNSVSLRPKRWQPKTCRVVQIGTACLIQIEVALFYATYTEWHKWPASDKLFPRFWTVTGHLNNLQAL